MKENEREKFDEQKLYYYFYCILAWILTFQDVFMLILKVILCLLIWIFFFPCILICCFCRGAHQEPVLEPAFPHQFRINGNRVQIQAQRSAISPKKLKKMMKKIFFKRKI
mmetsp:Transcript_7762/g.5823  ORF Transcript_7762/g.5823 Transcript_7762/m.5823 type:complete len:110 (+) Transcript_7762:308-637(+)